MALQTGRLFILRVSNGGSPETFSEVAEARENSISINNESVDVTTKGSNGWRELLEGAGNQSMSLSVSGVIGDSVAYKTFREAAMNKSIDNYELVYGNGDKFSGAFQITSFDNAGSQNGEVTFSASLESAGPITFTAAA